jgi:multicomponent Na+:H+ antiporter subunit G
MLDTVTAILIAAGAILMFVAGLGITRMPDLFLRMSATTKVATLGVGTILLAVTLYFNDLVTTFHAVATILFIFISAPVGAHMIGRAAYFTGVPLWKGTLVNDLSGHYDPQTHQLESVSIPGLEAHMPDLRVCKVRISETSPAAGKTLAQIELRKTYGFTVLAVNRGSLVISNPDGDVRLFADDDLILIGPPELRDDLAALFGSTGEDVGEG